MAERNKLDVEHIAWAKASDYAGHSFFCLAVAARLRTVFLVAHNNRMFRRARKIQLLRNRLVRSPDFFNFFKAWLFVRKFKRNAGCVSVDYRTRVQVEETTGYSAFTIFPSWTFPRILRHSFSVFSSSPPMNGTMLSIMSKEGTPG